MKWLAIAILTLSFGVASREMLWRLEHRQVAEASSGSFIAEAYFLGEGGSQSYGRGSAPYGVGVYVRHTLNPLRSFGATLVFAGYCSTESLRWPHPDELLIQCSSDTQPEILLSSLGRVKITYKRSG